MYLQEYNNIKKEMQSGNARIKRRTIGPREHREEKITIMLLLIPIIIMLLN